MSTDDLPSDDHFPDGPPVTVTIRHFDTWETGVGETRDHVFRATWANGEWRELPYLPAAWAPALDNNGTARRP